MISPAGRLLWLTALLIVPACTLSGIAPGLRLYAYAVVFGCTLLFGLDAYRGYMRLRRIKLSAPAFLKTFKGRRSSLTLKIDSLKLVCGTVWLSELAVSATFQGSSDVLRKPRKAVAASGVPRNEAADFLTDSGRASAPFALEIFFVPTRRGLIRLDAGEIEAPSPWKLWRITTRKALKTEIRVLPDLARDPTARLLLAARTGGMRTQRLAGRGREFERVRDYAPGDSYDEIAWKATARRSKPVVRVLQVERTQDIYAIVDSSRLSARNDAAEEFVTAALSMALATENAGDNFGLVAFSDRVNHFLPAVRGRAHFARCRDALFDLEPEQVSPDFAELFSFLQVHIRRRALLLFLTDLSDAILTEIFMEGAPMLARRHLVTLNTLSTGVDEPLFSGNPPETENQIIERLAGHIRWSRQGDLARKLQHLGIQTLPLRAGSAAHDLVENYRAIKKRQLL